jgi:hypothetical protein
MQGYDKIVPFLFQRLILDHKLAWNKKSFSKLITFEIILILVPMKKLHIALLSTAVLLIVSCKEEVEKPKVIYDA